MLVLKSHRRWNAGRQDWTKRNEDVLDKELKGLKVRYNRPDGGKREWRCNKVMDPADRVSNQYIISGYWNFSFLAEVRDRRKWQEKKDHCEGILRNSHEIQGENSLVCRL